MTVNNETGVIQPISQIADLCAEHNVVFHTDAAQAIGKEHIDLKATPISMLSLTGHKFYGPKGIGAMFIRKEFQDKLKPLISGGGQEKGIRSGTLTPFLLSGLGKACELAGSEYENDTQWVSNLKSQFWNKLTSQISGVSINGDLQHRYQGNLNIAIEGVKSRLLIQDCKEVAMSAGAACLSDEVASDEGEPSYVLTALGIDKKTAFESVRFSFGRFTTEEEVDLA